MKSLISAIAVVLALALGAHAQAADKTPQTAPQPAQPDQQMQMGCKMMGGGGMGGGMMGGGMGGGKMGCKMCGMMSHGAMTHDVLDVVTEMLKIQQRIIGGVTPSEKDALLKETTRLLERVDQMQKTAHSMPMMHNMPMDHSMPQPDSKAPQKSQDKTDAPKPQMQHQH